MARPKRGRRAVAIGAKVVDPLYFFAKKRYNGQREAAFVRNARGRLL